MIAINFAGRNYRLIARIRAGLMAGSVLFLASVEFLGWSAASLRADAAMLEGKLEKLQAEDKLVVTVLTERDKLSRDLAAMSGLLDAKRMSWTRLLTGIEAVVPPGVALLRVELNPRDFMATLDGTAQSPEALRNLVVGMEKSRSFKDPYLKHQSLDKGSISFNVVSVYTKEPGVQLDQGKR